jgi:hypothetical protein
MPGKSRITCCAICAPKDAPLQRAGGVLAQALPVRRPRQAAGVGAVQVRPGVRGALVEDDDVALVERRAEHGRRRDKARRHRLDRDRARRHLSRPAAIACEAQPPKTTDSGNS